jgi:hypothetical protein
MTDRVEREIPTSTDEVEHQEITSHETDFERKECLLMTDTDKSQSHLIVISVFSD